MELFQKLSDALSDKPDLLSLLREIQAAYAQQAAQITELQERMQKARLDAATGVLTRAAFFDEVHAFLQETYPDFVKTGKFPVRKESFFIVVGDLAVLSFFNAVSQLEGDRVLSRSAEALKHHFLQQEIGRIGGDEFAVLVRNAEPFAIELALEGVRAEVSAEPPQWIDLDCSTWKDVAHYLQLLKEEGKDYFEHMTPKERVKKLANILVGIAAQRAQIAKSYERIKNAIRLRAGHGKLYYLAYMNHARKGACGITDRELAELLWVNRRKGDESLANSIMLFVLTKKAVAASQGGEAEMNYELLHEVAAATYYVECVKV